jgi:hypothetical protein
MKKLFLTSHVAISRKGIIQNGEQIAAANEKGTELLKEAYKNLGISYPKFFKMDNLGKLGIIGTEPFFMDGRLKEKYADDEIAVVLGNRSSSMESDVLHYQNYTEDKASPSVFVYTLPNIVIGEICIRHQLFSESNFYIFEKFDAEALLNQAKILLSTTNCKACILGWVESFEENFEAVFYLLEEDAETEATEELLTEIYSKHGLLYS